METITTLKKMTMIVFFLNFLCFASFGQSFEWAKRAGASKFDLGYATCTDDSGNVYISGKYEGNSKFDGTTVSNRGNHDIYVAKYNASGILQWVRTAGGTIGDYTHAMACDGVGNVYITGEFETTCFWGPDSTISMKSSGSNDVFVAKYNSTGTLIFANKLGGGTSNDQGLGITLSNDNLYVTGQFKGTCTFGSTILESEGESDIFIAKVTSSGVFQWVKSAGGVGEDEGKAITSDASGNIYMTGYFTNSAKFGDVRISSNGRTDAFIAKYNSIGAVLWVKNAGGNNLDDALGIMADNSERIFITGGFRNVASFGDLTLTSTGSVDIFVACYNSSGNALWARKAGGIGGDHGRAIDLDASSNVYITGNYELSGIFGTTTISGADSTEIFFASYDASGNFKWVLKADGEADVYDNDRFIEMGLSIAVDKSRNVYASGTYRSNSTFGGTTLAPFSTHTQVFLTKINQGAPSNTITANGPTTFCLGGAVELKGNLDSNFTYRWQKDGVNIDDATSSNYQASMSGNYTLTTRIKDSSVVSNSILVTVTNSIVASITPLEPVLMCRDSNLFLTANIAQGTMYQWNKDGIDLPGAINSSFHPNISGNYQVKVIQGSCIDWSEIVNVTVNECNKDSILDPLGIFDGNLINKDPLIIKILPNPNNGLFTIEINMENIVKGGGRIEIEIINSVGQLVFKKAGSYSKGYVRERVELDGNLPTGIYLLQVNIGNKVEETRIMFSK